MNKPKIYFAIGLMFLMLCTVSAIYWIYSNQVSVAVTKYQLSLEPLNQNVILYQNATFTANLTLGGLPVSGATIYLYYADGTPTEVSNTTDVNGLCILSYNMTEVGTYNFKARYEIP